MEEVQEKFDARLEQKLGFGRVVYRNAWPFGFAFVIIKE